ncbi:unnamed protein product [Parnassius mnemosyne]|uniref:Uncharacterized protein n=1 Tax=Parnassius mnemosyne TaxID=213953 RepID=A0AAV1KAI9_9NEOP
MMGCQKAFRLIYSHGNLWRPKTQRRRSNSTENRTVADSWAKSQISRRERHLSQLKQSSEKFRSPTSCLNVCQ